MLGLVPVRHRLLFGCFLIVTSIAEEVRVEGLTNNAEDSTIMKLFVFRVVLALIVLSSLDAFRLAHLAYTHRFSSQCHDVALSALPSNQVLNTRPSTRTPLVLKAVPLPTCSAADFYKVVAGAGLMSSLSQLGLTWIFRRSNEPILNRNAGYTAHTAVGGEISLSADEREPPKVEDL